jgi:hypothetical protein
MYRLIAAISLVDHLLIYGRLHNGCGLSAPGSNCEARSPMPGASQCSSRCNRKANAAVLRCDRPRTPPVTGGSTDRVDSKEKEMTKVRNVATLFALCGVTALPACSMFGNNQASRSGYPTHASTQLVSASPQSTQLSQDMIQQVQGRLQQQGIYHGSVDGLWGPGTESAVRGYQQQHNLNASGKLDADTLASLNLGTNQNFGNAQPADQRYGSNYNPPINSNSPNNPPPASNPAVDSSQPNTTTTR